MKMIISLLVIVIIAVSIGPFIDLGTKIEWTTYLGMPLVILTGSTGVAFITKRFEVIIGGVVISVLWPVLCETAYSILSSL